MNVNGAKVLSSSCFRRWKAKTFFGAVTLTLGALTALAGCNGKGKEMQLLGQDVSTGAGAKVGANKACSNLHLVTNISELLQQMQENLDSKCIFDISPNELEQIWKIKIFRADREYLDKNGPLTGKEFLGKPLKDAVDTFVVAYQKDPGTGIKEFQILPSTAFVKAGGSFFPDGIFPGNALPPLKVDFVGDSAHQLSIPIGAPRDPVANLGQLKQFTLYCWLGSSRGEPAALYFFTFSEFNNMIFYRESVDKHSLVYQTFVNAGREITWH